VAVEIDAKVLSKIQAATVAFSGIGFASAVEDRIA